MLCKGLGIKQNLSSLSCMAVLENFDLVVGRNFVPLSNMIEITGLVGLGAFLIMETKERAVLLLEVIQKQF